MSEVASLAVRIGADITALTRGLGEAQQNIGAWAMGAGKAVSSFGTKAQSVGSSMVGMSQPFVDAIMGGIGAASEMEGIMKQLEIMGGLSADQLQVVSDKALQLGADTMFSASDAASAMLELVKAGMSVEQAMIAIDGSMAGAAAGGVALNEMASIVATSLAQFGLTAGVAVPANFDALQTEMGVTDQMFTDFGNNDTPTTQMQALANSLGMTTDELYEVWNAAQPLTPEIEALATQLGISAGDWDAYRESVGNVTPEIQTLIDKTGLSGQRLAEMFGGMDNASMVANTLAAAAVASSADVAELADGLANVGPVAAQAGLDFNDTAAALAVLSNNGIKGAEAGTQLKSLLLNLNTDAAKSQLDALGGSMYDAEGNTRDLDTVLDEIADSLAAMTPEEQAVAMKNLAGSYGITALSALLSAGGIDQMQLAMDKVPSAAELAQGASDTFAGKVDALKGSLETLQVTAFTPLMHTLGDFAEQLTPIINDFTDWAAKNPELITGLGLLMLGVSGAGMVLMLLGTAASLAGGGLAVLGGAITFMSGPAGLLLLALVGLGAVLTNPDIQAGLAAWPENFRMLGDIISTSVSNAVDTAKAKFDELMVGVNGVVRDLEWVVLNIQKNFAAAQAALGINVDANIAIASDADTRMQMIDIAKTLEGDINTSLAAGGPLQINMPQLEFLATDEANQLAGGDAIALLAAEIADPVAIQEAINAAMAAGNAEGIKALLPLSLELANDPRVQMQTLLTDALTMGGTTGEAFNALLPMATELDINTQELITQYQASADAAAAAQTYPVTISVGVTLVPVSVDSSQIAAVVTMANGAAVVAGGEIPALNTGGVILREGVALVHAGERVLTREETDAYHTPRGADGGRYVFNITTYGSTPYEVAQMVQQAISEAAL